MSDESKTPRLPPDNPGSSGKKKEAKASPGKPRTKSDDILISADEAVEILSGWREDCRVAGGFLTCLPFFKGEGEKPKKGVLAASMRAFPLIGAGLGIAAALVLAVAIWLGLPLMLAGCLAVGALILMTGGLHEDALADFADSLGGHDKKSRLAIMADTQTGTFGVLALVFSVGLRVLALASFSAADSAAAALIAAASASRCAPLVMAWAMKPAKKSGQGALTGQPKEDRLYAGVGLGAALALLFLGPVGGILALLCGALAGLGLAYYAKKTLGGYTGDVMGSAQQVCEIAILLAASALL